MMAWDKLLKNLTKYDPLEEYKRVLLRPPGLVTMCFDKNPPLTLKVLEMVFELFACSDKYLLDETRNQILRWIYYATLLAYSRTGNSDITKRICEWTLETRSLFGPMKQENFEKYYLFNNVKTDDETLYHAICINATKAYISSYGCDTGTRKLLRQSISVNI
jgi:hypothetical protein